MGNEPKRGQLAANADYQDQDEARKLVDKFCKDSGKWTIDELEEKMGYLCKKVYEEAVVDAGGERPLYMRVDLLLDRQGRVWLGERESWGADLNGNDQTLRMDPTYKELAVKMLARTKQQARKMRSFKRTSQAVKRKNQGTKSTVSRQLVKKVHLK